MEKQEKKGKLGLGSMMSWCDDVIGGWG